jgi:signal peptidase I
MNADHDAARRARLERDAMAWPPAAWEEAVADWPGEARTTAASSGPSVGWGVALARDVIQTVVLTVVLFVGVRLVVQNYMVESVSMQPTLVEGQFIWVDKVGFRLAHGPQRGDIVVFQSWGQDKPFVKRVIGLPGEELEVRDGHVYADGKPIDEPYLTQSTEGHVGPIDLAPDQYYVMGDNRGNSGDSRIYGPLPSHDIIGRAWLRYWPPNAIGLLHGATDRSYASDPK